MVIETIAPIPIEELKKFFVDDSVSYMIKYNESQLKGTKLVTYLSNLDIASDISFDECPEEDVYAFLKDYLHSRMVVNLPTIEVAIINILLSRKGLSDNVDSDFIDDNAEIIDTWIAKLDSLTLYNMYIVSTESFKSFVTDFEEDTTDDLEGVNFVSLLKHPFFYELYTKINKDNLKYYSKYFNDYMFRGKPLFSFWANENNPLFLLTSSIATGEITGEGYVNAVNTSIKEIADVASV